MAKKTYKGAKKARTLWEHVQKGLVDTESTFSFTPITYNKKDEILSPYLHWIDSNNLKKMIDHKIMMIRDSGFGDDLHEQIKKIIEKKPMKPGFTLGNFRQAINELHVSDRPIQSHLMNDIFNVYYNQMSKLTFEDRQKSNSGKYKIIEQVNNPTLKILTEGNSMKAAIMTEAIVLQMLIMMVLCKNSANEKDQLDYQEMLKSLRQQQNPSQGTSKPKDPNAQTIKIPMPPQQQDPISQIPGEGQGAPGNDLDDPDQISDDKGEGDGSSDGNNPSDQGLNAQNAPGNQGPPGLNDGNDGSGQHSQDDEGSISQTSAQKYDGQSGSGSGSSTKDTSLEQQLESMMKKMFSSQAAKDLQEKLEENAKNAIENLDELLGEEEIKELWEDGDVHKIQQRLDPGNMDRMREMLHGIQLNMGSVKREIKTLLDKSINYFSSQEKPEYESLLETDNIAGIEDWALLHPKLRNLFIEDIMVKDHKKIGKIDVYVDVSGSMHSYCGSLKDDEGSYVRRDVFAKALTLRLKESNMLNNLYTFEGNVSKQGDKLIDVLSIDGNGGTNLNNVIRKINKTQTNSLIITDADDTCNEYSEYAFFIGIDGADFSDFSSEVRKRFHDKNQMVVFNGSKVCGVDSRGYVLN